MYLIPAEMLRSRDIRCNDIVLQGIVLELLEAELNEYEDLDYTYSDIFYEYSFTDYEQEAMIKMVKHIVNKMNVIKDQGLIYKGELKRGCVVLKVIGNRYKMELAREQEKVQQLLREIGDLERQLED